MGTNEHEEGANESNSSLSLSGRRSLHIQKHTCSSCGYPAAKTRKCTFSPTSNLHPSIHPATPNPAWLVVKRASMKATLGMAWTNVRPLQTTGARRPSAETPSAPAACATSRTFPAGSRTASGPAYPRTTKRPFKVNHHHGSRGGRGARGERRDG